MQRFDPASLTTLDEPVRRYLGHALARDAPLGSVRLEMRGRIKVGVWLTFAATWQGDARSFRWAARAGGSRLRPLHVVDRFAGGAASTDVRLLGRLPLVHAADEDTVRSGAGRAAAEAIWNPGALLPETGVAWEAESDEHIVATWDVPPERPRLWLHIDPSGAVRSVCVMRWDDGRHGYVPCGGEVGAERRLGSLTIPSEVTVGWWYGTPRYEPFFACEVTTADVV